MSGVQRPILVHWADNHCSLRIPGVVTMELTQGTVDNLIRDLINGRLRIDGSRWSGAPMSRRGKPEAG